jgi:hypothetical protein
LLVRSGRDGHRTQETAADEHRVELAEKIGI